MHWPDNSSQGNMGNCGIEHLKTRCTMRAVSIWNAVYLSQAVEELKKRGEVVPEEYLPHITPLGWEHINLIGQYSFSHQSARSLNNLRPLRLPEQEHQETQEKAEEDRSAPSHS